LLSSSGSWVVISPTSIGDAARIFFDSGLNDTGYDQYPKLINRRIKEGSVNLAKTETANALSDVGYIDEVALFDHAAAIMD